jgi:hypothetical protein
MGLVLRNHIGEAIVGKACPMKNMLNATRDEALALLKCLELIEQLGCSSIMWNHDSMEFACNGMIEVWSPY